MPDILIRNLSDGTLAFWKHRAARHRRSLQAEIATVLDETAERETARASNPYAEFAAWAREFRRRTAGTVQTDASELIREDRDSHHGHPL